MKTLRIFAILLCCALLCAPCPLSFARADAPSAGADGENAAGDHIIVSLGDSYSSGEGIEPFYGQELMYFAAIRRDPDVFHDFLAHRSAISWPGRLYHPIAGVPLWKKRKTGGWYFAAASGALTQNLFDTQEKYYDRDGLNGTEYLAPQLDVLRRLAREGKTVDYVTLTLGGNDAGFASIIEQAAKTPNRKLLGPHFVRDSIEDIWDYFYALGGIRDQLLRAYNEISNLTGGKAHIIVVGYPLLMCDYDEAQGNIFFSRSEIEDLNKNTHDFNEQIRLLVDSCRNDMGMDIEFVSVEAAFAGHGAYSAEPFINPVLPVQQWDITDNLGASSYSIHPNDAGAAAYARCVQGAINAHYERTHLEVDQRKPTAFDPEAALYSYLRDTLIPEYGVLSTETLYGIEDRTDAQLGGILSADIYDYDCDGAPEMLVSRFHVAPAGKIGPDIGAELVLTLEMYEADGGQVVLGDEKPLLLQGITGVQSKYASTAACFRYQRDDYPHIAVETFCGAEESTVTLSAWRYTGFEIEFEGGVGNQSYGSGSLLARRAVYESGIATAANCADWWEVLAGSAGICRWETAELWDTEAHDWEMPSADDYRHFFEIYKNGAAGMGITVAQDLRIVPLQAGAPLSEVDFDARYNARFTQPQADVYAGTPGFAALWSVRSYMPLGGQLELHREDALGSLNSWR